MDNMRARPWCRVLVLGSLAWVLAEAGIVSSHAAGKRAGPSEMEFFGDITVDGEALPAYKHVKATRRVPPVYPFSSKRAGEQGTVTVGAVVDEAGKVVGVFVMDSEASSAMQQAAMACMRKWLYPPMEKDGHPIRFVAIQPIVFRISN